MTIAIFNPEHDLCLSKGRAHFVPPKSAVDFARRDASTMQPLYPDAHCTSVYDLSPTLARQATHVVAWGWNTTVRWELLKRGIAENLLPSEAEIACWRRLQHRTTFLPLQENCHPISALDQMQSLLQEREHWVLKAPWSGAGRGLRWVHGWLTDIDRRWLLKTIATQQCAIAEPRRDVHLDLGLEYCLAEGGISFLGLNPFRTQSGVFRENIPIEEVADLLLQYAIPLATLRGRLEPWLKTHIVPFYHGPLGIDIMLCTDGSCHVAEVNLRHTMGMLHTGITSATPNPMNHD